MKAKGKQNVLRSRRIITLIFIIVSPLALLGSWNWGKYAGAFMETGIGARSMGMGGAGVALVQDVSAVYWNPAALIKLETLQIHGMHSERFAGVVNRDFLGMGLPLDDRSALGFGIYRLGIDGIPVTALRDPNRALGEIYIDETGRLVQNDVFVAERFDDNEFAIVVSFARRKSTRFSFGGNIKVIRKKAGEDGAWGIGFDFGFLIMPYKSMRVGAVLVDGTSTLVAWSGGRKELISPQLKTGIAYPFQFGSFILIPAVDLLMHLSSRGSADQITIGSAGFAFQGGLELGFKDRIALRVGLDRGQLTLGSGFKISAVCIDYGFSHHLDLGNTHRISMTLSWDKNRLLRF